MRQCTVPGKKGLTFFLINTYANKFRPRYLYCTGLWRGLGHCSLLSCMCSQDRTGSYIQWHVHTGWGVQEPSSTSLLHHFFPEGPIIKIVMLFLIQRWKKNIGTGRLSNLSNVDKSLRSRQTPAHQVMVKDLNFGKDNDIVGPPWGTTDKICEQGQYCRLLNQHSKHTMFCCLLQNPESKRLE